MDYISCSASPLCQLRSDECSPAVYLLQLFFLKMIRRRAKTGEELEFIQGFKQNLSGKLCVTIYSFAIDFKVSDDGTIVGF